MSGPDGHAQCQDAAPSSAQLHQLVEGVHAWVQPDGSWWINNAGAVTGPEGTIIIDTCATEDRTRLFFAAVDRATGGAPIRMAVNTHEHGDHTHGNSLLPDGAAIISHAHSRRSMESGSLIGTGPRAWDPVPDWGEVTLRLPSITVRDGLTIHTGGRRIEVRHPGYAAHTDGDLVAWLPDERILFAGDLVFHGLTPLVYAGSVEGALESLDWLAGFGADRLVPGHGPVATGPTIESVLDDHRRYYRLVLEAAAHGRRRGLTPLETAQQADLGEFAAWADPERLVLNVHRAYAEAGGSTVDVSRAFRDAMIWNGGPLTTHVCCPGDTGGFDGGARPGEPGHRRRRLSDHLHRRAPGQDHVRLARPVDAGQALLGVAGRGRRLHRARGHRHHHRGGAVPSHPPPVLDGVVAVMFLAGAALALREATKEEEEEEELVARESVSGRRVLTTSFLVIFVAEWGDLTQILTANLAAHYHSPLSVAVGATLALWSVAALAVIGGQSLLKFINIRTLRIITAVALTGLAVFSAWEALR